MEHRAYGQFPNDAPTPVPPEVPREGWYPDPHGAPGVNRWWTGTQWTDRTQFAPPPPMRPTVTAGPHLAGYGSRLGGYLLDAIILGVISIPLLIPFGGAFHERTITVGKSTGHIANFGGHGFGILAQTALVLVYGTLFIGSRRGQTPGMMIVGIRCVGADTGTSVGHGKAFLRALVEYTLAAALVIPWIIDMLFPLWDERNQTIHDKSVGSLVISGVRHR